jgi:tRNA(fMet)-specific endonuclease VapC
MEVVKGLHKQRRTKKLKQFLSHISAVEVLAFDQASAKLAGRILADLERTGQPIGRIDPMIAAVALQHGLTLVTGNLIHYQRIQALDYKLQLDNWRSYLFNRQP